MNRLFKLFLIGLLGFCLSLLLSWWVSTLAASKTPATLTEQGFAQLAQGKPTQALRTWKEAEAAYQEANNQAGSIGSRVNQSLALQALGLYPQACSLLTETLKLDSSLCLQDGLKFKATLLEQQLKRIPLTAPEVAGLKSLSDVLRVTGRLNEAHQILTMLANKEPAATVSLSLANVERSLYLRDRDRYERTDAPKQKLELLSQLQQHFQEASDRYAAVSQSGVKHSKAAIFAQVNQLSLLVDQKRWLSQHRSQSPLTQSVQVNMPALIEQLEANTFKQVPPVSSIYAQLSLAESLRELGQYDRAVARVEAAREVAQTIQQPHESSYVKGELATILLKQGQTEAALSHFQQAAALAQSTRAWDAVYRWHRALGQIYQAQGRPQPSRESYATAIAALDQVRGNILAVNPDVQFSFQEKVEPVYREYIGLLLTQHQQSDLERAVQVTQRLQQVELENFLGCGKLDLVNLNQINLPKDTAVFYILNLDKQIVVIVRSSDKKLHAYTADLAEVSTYAKDLNANLQSDDFVSIKESVFIPYAQSLYQQLIAPAQQGGYLPAEGTLVFVVDFNLQTIPLALLHNGQDYLIQRYSIATTLGGQLREPQPLTSQKPDALIAGLSSKAPSFQDPKVPTQLAPLPEVEAEIESLAKQTNSTILLNRSFTVSNLQQQLMQHAFPVVHLTTHGQFSSDPEETFMLAWDQTINIDQLYRLVRNRTDRNTSIELLVLSACQTAKGDRRSSLGLAGLSTQAGARSTVASLWSVDAPSTATLMSQFYQSLHTGKSKAEALRAAQLSLLTQPETSHPYYWSPFILVGSWL